MKTALIAVSGVLALAWLPLAWRFNRGWKTRRNPVSLAICAMILRVAYTHALFILAIAGQTSWRFFATASLGFDLVVVINFYAAFRWSDRRFESERREHRVYSVPPTNKTSTPRSS